MIGSGHSLDQNRHLFIAVLQTSLFPVFKGREIHGTRIHGTHRVLKRLQSFFRSTLIHTENGFIFPCEGISESVLKETGGAYNDRMLPEVFQRGPEFFPDIGRKHPRQQSLSECLRFCKISLLRPLGDPRFPTIVGHDISIKDIRSDVIGIMGLPIFSVLRQFCPDDLPGQKHTTGLSSQRTASDHPVPELKIVFGAKIFPDHLLKTPVPCQCTFYDLLLRLSAELSSLIIHLCQDEKTVMAVEILILALFLFFLHKLIVSAHGNSSIHSFKLTLPRRDQSSGTAVILRCPRFPGIQQAGMGKKHPGRIPVPDFQRMQIHPPVPVIHIKKKLRGIPDPGDCVKGMPPPQKWEIRNRIQLEKIGTGDPEKIPHHQIRVPYRLKRRKTVKHIEGVFPLFCDPVMNIHGKCFKPFVRVELKDLKPRPRRKKWFMLRKPHVDQVSAILYRLLGEGDRKEFKLFQIRYTPYHIVAHPDIVQKSVHSRQPALYLIKCSHNTPPSLLRNLHNRKTSVTEP